MKLFGLIAIVVLLAIAGFQIFEDFEGETLFSSAFKQDDSPDDDHADDDDDDEAGVDTKQQLLRGSLRVILSVQTQQLAGIETIAAENIALDAEDKAYAAVVDMTQLVNQRSSYRNMQAELEVAKTRVNNAAQILRRREKLNAETTNISQRQLQEARAEFQTQNALFKSVQTRLENSRAEMRQRWNPAVTELALQDGSGIFERLLNQQDYLLLLSLRPDQQLSRDAAYVFVNRIDERHTARKAYVVSPAPYSEINLPGETYFLRTPAEGLRVGMRLHVWLPGTGFSGTGIGIPDEAIVWYAGQAWAYVQADEETFSRRRLPQSLRTGNTWLVNENFTVGDRIVINGAQTLLSEEFKWAIPDEDDD